MAPAARNAPRSRALTLLAWFLCALLGPGPALSGLHFALVAHRVCLEHGTLEHVDSSAESAALGAEALGVEASDGATRSAHGAGKSIKPGAAAGEHGHELCGVASAAGTLALLPAPAAAVAVLHWLSPAGPSGAERAHQGIALLSYAPKLAPPAHA